MLQVIKTEQFAVIQKTLDCACKYLMPLFIGNQSKLILTTKQLSKGLGNLHFSTDKELLFWLKYVIHELNINL